jgi:hypothetical protein
MVDVMDGRRMTRKLIWDSRQNSIADHEIGDHDHG